MDSDIQDRINTGVRAAMRARDKQRLGILRLVNAEIKQVAIDTKQDLTEAGIRAILSRMVKQRQNSATQYREGNRLDLAEQELYEVEVIQEFLPAQLSTEGIVAAINSACEELNVDSQRDIGKVMAHLSKTLAGQAHMGVVSKLVRDRLTA